MEDTKTTLIYSAAPVVDRIESDGDAVKLGDWYWFKHQYPLNKNFDCDEILCCVMRIGSNYAELKYVDASSYSWDWRVHFNEWNERCRHEPNPQSYFDGRSQEEKRHLKRLNEEVRDLCARLGVSNSHRSLLEKKDAPCSLSVVSSAVDTTEYKSALIKAKDDDLPALFAQIKDHNEQLARWLGMPSLSLEAQCENMEEAIESINDRVFAVTVYAGLSEHCEQILGGQPASIDEKLRIMQGKLFMDEECLLGYEEGGMEFSHISKFDRWLSKKANLNRILPFPRCMVAFQVRRYEKHRESGGSLVTAWINFDLAQADKLTFLYIRNGDRLYRISTELKFGDEIFADRDEFNFTEPLMVNTRSSDHRTITVRDYEERVRKARQERRKHDSKVRQWKKERAAFQEWEQANPDKNPSESGFSFEARNGAPFFHSSFNADEWAILDDSNVYVDDVNDRVRKQANYYNRISTLVQGLLDRSMALHPHPPVKLWTPQGFDQFIELVYDHDRTLYDGPEPPSWEEYKARCNESLGVGSVVCGQHAVWYSSLPREIDKRSYQNYIPYQYTEGNPGPGMIETIKEWSSRSRKATFRWVQSRYIRRKGDMTYNRSIKVHADKLFNISGYKRGDYKQFFNDPRTRRDYLKWAHMLLTAEEYHSGNVAAAKAKA